MISGQCSCWIPPPCWPPGWLPHLGMFSVNWFLIIYICDDSWEVWYSTFQGSYFHWLFDELICYAKRMYLPENPHPASNGDARMIYSACTWLRISLWLAWWCWVDLLRMYLPENPPPAPIVMLGWFVTRMYLPENPPPAPMVMLGWFVTHVPAWESSFGSHSDAGLICYVCTCLRIPLRLP